MRIPSRRTFFWVSAAALLLLAVVASVGVEFPDPQSRVTPENFNRLEMGMSEAEVYTILGEPTEVTPGGEGKRALWRSGPKIILVEFRGDRVCTIGQTSLYKKTAWEILIGYAKKGAEKIGISRR